MDGNLKPKAFEPYVQRTVGFGEAIKRAYKNYFNFSGRASLSEYWWFYLYSYLFSILFMLLIFIVGDFITSMAGNPNNIISTIVLVIAFLVMFAALLPSLSLLVRRLHDIGKGGGWIFISFVPFIGGIWLLVLTLQPSEPYANRFGPIPNAQPLA